MLRGHQIRRQFRVREDAIKECDRLNLEAAQSPTEEARLTTLSKSMISDAEAAFEIIRRKFVQRTHTLVEVAHYFAQHYFRPETHHTVTTLKQIYIDMKRKEGTSAVQIRNIANRLGHLEAAFPSALLNEITSKQIEAWMEKRYGALAPKSWNVSRGDIAAFFNWCLKQDPPLIAKSPMTTTIKKTVPRSVPEIVTLQTARGFMSDLESIEGGRYALVGALMLFAGIRPQGEMQRIEQLVAAETMDDRKLILRPPQIFLGPRLTKTGGPRWIDVKPNLAAWFDAYPLSRLGLSVRRFSEKHMPQLRKKHSIGQDALRHSFCSYFGRAFGTKDAAIAAGHTETMQQEHYGNFSMSKEDASAFFEICPTGRAL